jgi:hypothetical protein
MTPGTALGTQFAYKGGNYPGTGGTCGSYLADGDSCTVVVTFTPTSLGAKSDTLEIDYNNGNSTQSASISLNGTGS